MELRRCVTDDDLEAWRQVRLAVVPDELCVSVAELREQDSPERLMLLAVDDGTVVGSGFANRSETAGGGFVMPRVRPEHRRRGVGTALLEALGEHVATLGVPELRSGVDDEGALAFATRHGFAEVDREVQQVRAVGEEPEPAPLPDGVEVVTLSDRPELWAASYDGFGAEALADFALYAPLEISAEQWSSTWVGDPMFLAVEDGAVIGCAGLFRDDDQPDRAENALTAVRRDRRGRGVAAHLKRRTLHWAAGNGIREIYTWTQAGNTAMIRLNEHLGYVLRSTSITVARPV